MNGRPRFAMPALLAITAACNAGVDADFDLQLIPHVPIGDDVFGDGEPTLLTLRDAARGVEFRDLGVLGGSQSSSAPQGDFGPLVDTYLGLLLQDQSNEQTPETAIAWGEAGPFTLGADAQSLEADVLVKRVGSIGSLGALESGALGAAIALLPDGSVAIFGGANSTTANGTTTVRYLPSLNAAEWPFDTLEPLPGLTGLVGATAVPVSVRGDALVFVAGGRPQLDPPTDNSRFAALWDPSTGEVAWSANSMLGSRGEAQALALEDGQILVFGGVSGSGLYIAATWELFNADDRRFTPGSGAVTTGSMGAALASIGADGALVCGGGLWEGQGTPSTSPQNACYAISLAGAATPRAPLPIALQGLAMVALSDGQVLAAGGLTEIAEQDNASPATGRAFLYDPASDTWTETAALAVPRALHKLVALPDGRAAAIGGVASGGILRSSLGDAVRCSEIFDPAHERWTTTERCTNAGSGASPAVAWSPEHGAFAIAGIGGAGPDYGIMGFPPAFGE